MKKKTVHRCVCVCGAAAGESHKCLLAIARRWRRRCVKYRAAPRTRDQYAPKTRVHGRCLFFPSLLLLLLNTLKKKKKIIIRHRPHNDIAAVRRRI